MASGHRTPYSRCRVGRDAKTSPMSNACKRSGAFIGTAFIGSHCAFIETTRHTAQHCIHGHSCSARGGRHRQDRLGAAAPEHTCGANQHGIHHTTPRRRDLCQYCTDTLLPPQPADHDMPRGCTAGPLTRCGCCGTTSQRRQAPVPHMRRRADPAAALGHDVRCGQVRPCKGNRCMAHC